MRARVIDTETLQNDGKVRVFEGEDHGAEVSFFITRTPPGSGPSLHRHPYAEVFVIQEGEATFTADGESVEARAGQIVVVPAGTSHGFTNSGTGTLGQVGIHPEGRMRTEWLEDQR